RGDLAQAVAQAGLDLLDAALERVEGLVALALERVEPGREPPLDLLHRTARDRVDALGEDAVGLAREALDREVELAPQPPRRLLARGADRGLELHGGRLGVACRLVRDRPPELLDLLPADVGESLGDALNRVGLVALDARLELALALAEPLVELVERVPALGRVQLELRRAL